MKFRVVRQLVEMVSWHGRPASGESPMAIERFQGGRGLPLRVADVLITLFLKNQLDCREGVLLGGLGHGDTLLLAHPIDNF